MRLSDKDDTLKYYEVLINSKISSLDRSSAEEVNTYNTLIEDYRKSLFNEITESLKDNDGNKIDLDKVLADKKALFKPLNVQIGKHLTGQEFGPTDLKDLIKKKNKE